MSPACALFLGLLLTGWVEEETRVRFHLFLTGLPRLIVMNAVDGAARRLESARCRRVLDEFADGEGRTLSSILDAEGTTAAQFVRSLYYVDGDEYLQCRAEYATLAFTSPGNRVVFVCGSRFVRELPSDGRRREAIIIHEALHALGLGENPPTSQEITQRVMQRCR